MRKKMRNVVLVGIVLAMMIPVCSVLAKVTKDTGKNVVVLEPFVITNDNDGSETIIYPDAEGHAVVVDPNGNVELVINGTFSGLGIDKGYMAIIKKASSNSEGELLVRQPFQTNKSGQGSFTYKVKVEDDTDEGYYECEPGTMQVIEVDTNFVVLHNKTEFAIEISR